jgi:hypothetical protein
MADNEEAREKSSSLVVVGWMLVLFDALVIFFLPAAIRRGHPAGFETVAVLLAVAGLVLIITGYRGRRKAVS